MSFTGTTSKNVNCRHYSQCQHASNGDPIHNFRSMVKYIHSRMILTAGAAVPVEPDAFEVALAVSAVSVVAISTWDSRQTKNEVLRSSMEGYSHECAHQCEYGLARTLTLLQTISGEFIVVVVP